METIFKVGMKVWDDIHFKGQTGEVYEINEGRTMLIRVLFGNQKDSYTFSGCYFIDAKPTLSVVPYDFQLPEQIVQHEFKKYDRVLVKDVKSAEWEIDTFIQYSKTHEASPFFCYHFNWKYCIPFDAEVYENQ